MKAFLGLLLFSVLLISCKEQTLLEKEFNCKSSYAFDKLEKVDDINKKFSLKVPEKWATKLFYNEYETNIMSADSLKSFSNTYILDVSVILGDLELNNNFSAKVIQELKDIEQLENLKFKFDKFKDLPSVWFLSKGKKGKYTYHYFQLFAKKNATEYFEISTKIYGDELIDERLCESIALIDKIEF